MKFTQWAILALLSSTLFFTACEDEIVPADAPTIAVVADNTSPYPTDKIKFSITVNAPGGLKAVTFNGTSIKTYTNAEKSDQFTYEYTVPAGGTFGPTNYSFAIDDAQSPTLKGTFTVNATLQNPDFRGKPQVVTNFNSPSPNAQVAEIKFDSGPNAWEAAYKLTFNAADPANAANKVLQADRLGAHEWYFQGGGALFLRMTSPLKEDDVNALIKGERVLQMNVYMREVPKLVTLHKSPANPDMTKQQVDLSWKFGDATRAWNFVRQDTMGKGIGIAIEIGNSAAWAWNNGNPLGKKFFLVGSITKVGQWETVTFSRRVRVSTGTGPNDFVLNPARQSETTATFLSDPAVTLDKIDYMAIIINNRKTGFTNTGGWFEMPGDGNQWKADVRAGVSDDHNTYFLDNVRIIDAKDYDKNPNNG